MRLQLARRKALPIGLDIGASKVKLAQLRLVGNEIELLAAASAEMPADAVESQERRIQFLPEALRRITKSNVFEGNRCILALPAEETFILHLKLPSPPSKDVEQALQLELQNKLPYPVQDAVVRHITAGGGVGQADANGETIVVSVPRATIDTYLDAARRAKLEVVGINIDACAIVECFSRLFRRQADTARTTLFVDIGAASTQVALAHGKEIAFARDLPIGGRHMDCSVAEQMDMSSKDAHALRHDLTKADENGTAQDELYNLLQAPLNKLAEELTQCLRYYESVFRNRAVERAIFVGGQAYDKRLCQDLAKRLNLPAQVGDPLVRIKRVAGAGMEIGLDRRNPQPDWTVAIGLSLGASAA